MDGHLARELETHTCPICYDLMVPPEHAPFLLFPLSDAARDIVDDGCLSLAFLFPGYIARSDDRYKRGKDVSLESVAHLAIMYLHCMHAILQVRA